MAKLGVRTVNEMIGKTEFLKVDENINHWKLENIDLSALLYKPAESESVDVYKVKEQEHDIFEILDRKLIEAAQPALINGTPVKAEFDTINTDRSVGAMLSNEVSKVYGGIGLPDGTIHYKLNGSCGNSFGVFTAKGILFEIEGEANDYFGKGLSGGKLVIYPPKISSIVPHENMIIGNVAFYGATSGKAFINGLAGERFCVRNSGVTAVVEGIGDHGAEYMTGGKMVVLGETGRNFGAGMSGGYAFIWDVNKNFIKNFNPELSDIDPLSKEDKMELKSLIEEHYEETKSTIASNILENWDLQLRNFKKVMPRDYKRVLAEKLEKSKAKIVV
jgi:glutamate synthase (NADPH/NADH) large chain